MSMASGRLILNPRLVKLTVRSGTDIKRTLPHKSIRTIGAWCFVDHFGPTEREDAMSIGAHPHTGLQTVSWLFEGDVEHRDSLGSVQEIHPGELNIMTAGYGVAHSELSLPESKQMHGVQLWTVLPDSDRNAAPLFDHYSNLPRFEFEVLQGIVFVGEFMERVSPARTFSPLVGAEINIAPNSEVRIPLRSDFEYGLLLVSGDLGIDGEELADAHLYYASKGASHFDLASTSGAKFVLLGGLPFNEEIIMWWNFIGRTHEEIVEMRAAWNSESDRFPYFADAINQRIPAPEMPNLKLQSRGNLT